MSSSMYLVVVVFLGFLVFVRAIQIRRSNGRYRFPNQVPGLPLLGNTMPKSGQGPYTMALAQKYGEMYVESARPDQSLRES